MVQSRNVCAGVKTLYTLLRLLIADFIQLLNVSQNKIIPPLTKIRHSTCVRLFPIWKYWFRHLF